MSAYFYIIPMTIANYFINIIIYITLKIHRSNNVIRILSIIAKIIMFIGAYIPFFIFYILMTPIRLYQVYLKWKEDKQPISNLIHDIIQHISSTIPCAIFWSDIFYDSFIEYRDYESEIKNNGFISTHIQGRLSKKLDPFL